jgi:hypothetical protein
MHGAILPFHMYLNVVELNKHRVSFNFTVIRDTLNTTDSRIRIMK